MSDRPNVLFLMDDQHNANCLSCYGNETIETPNLDRLAENGVRFDRAYCQNPICMPSRVSVMTGQYPHRLGIYNNRAALGAEPIGLAHQFSRVGYDTGAFGKIHLPIEWPTDGFDTREVCDFADTKRFPHENDYYSYLDRVGLADEWDYGVACSEFPLKTYVSNIPEEHCVERWTADETINWLESRESDDPFFAWSTFQRPHPPFAPPPEWADRYEPEDIELPPREETFDGKPPVWLEGGQSEACRAAAETDIKQTVAYYYSLVTLIDEQIGRILDQLEAAGELEDTIIVFTSDHGDFAGEHGLISKNVSIPESLHRVPFIWAWGDEIAAGEVRDDLVELVDIYPTLCDLAGVPTPDQVQGQSLAPALTDGESVGRDAAFAVHEGTRTVRTEDWRLTYHTDDAISELYDKRADPWELENRWTDPDLQEIKADLLGRLHDFLAETEYRDPGNGGNLSGDRVRDIWGGEWWSRTGRINPSPLSHLGGPVLSDEDSPES